MTKGRTKNEDVGEAYRFALGDIGYRVGERGKARWARSSVREVGGLRGGGLRGGVQEVEFKRWRSERDRITHLPRRQLQVLLFYISLLLLTKLPNTQLVQDPHKPALNEAQYFHFKISNQDLNQDLKTPLKIGRKTKTSRFPTRISTKTPNTQPETKNPNPDLN